MNHHQELTPRSARHWATHHHKAAMDRRKPVNPNTLIRTPHHDPQGTWTEAAPSHTQKINGTPYQTQLLPGEARRKEDTGPVRAEATEGDLIQPAF